MQAFRLPGDACVQKLQRPGSGSRLNSVIFIDIQGWRSSCFPQVAMRVAMQANPAVFFGSSHGGQRAPNRGAQASPEEKPDLDREVSTQRHDVLLVMVSEDWKLIQQSLQSSGLRVLRVSDCKSASRVLAADPHVGAILTDAKLPDGNWCTVLASALAGGGVPSVLVCTSHEQHGLWSEVVSGGGCYRLVEPHRRKRLGEIISDPLLH